MSDPNSIFLLREYISEHEGDSPKSWEYEHIPFLEQSINGFSKQEVELFESEIWNWSDFHLFQLADPIYHSINSYLNAEFIFTKIFAKIEREEYLRDLCTELAACF